jgi:putative membrane protein
VLVLVLSYFSSGYSYYGYPYGWGIMGVMMLFMVPIMIIVLIAIAYIVYRGFSWGGYYGRYGEEEKETAMEILRRRYARGEISKEQYEQMKKDMVS